MGPGVAVATVRGCNTAFPCSPMRSRSGEVHSLMAIRLAGLAIDVSRRAPRRGTLVAVPPRSHLLVIERRHAGGGPPRVRRTRASEHSRRPVRLARFARGVPSVERPASPAVLSGGARTSNVWSGALADEAPPYSRSKRVGRIRGCDVWRACFAKHRRRRWRWIAFTSGRLERDATGACALARRRGHSAILGEATNTNDASRDADGRRDESVAVGAGGGECTSRHRPWTETGRGGCPVTRPPKGDARALRGRYDVSPTACASSSPRLLALAPESAASPSTFTLPRAIISRVAPTDANALWGSCSRSGGSRRAKRSAWDAVRRRFEGVEVAIFRPSQHGKIDSRSTPCAGRGDRQSSRFDCGPRSEVAVSRRRKDARDFEQEAMSLKDFARVMGIDEDTARKHAIVVPNGERVRALPTGKFPCRRIGNVTRVLLSEVLGITATEDHGLDGEDSDPSAEGGSEGDVWRRPLAGLRPSGRT